MSAESPLSAILASADPVDSSIVMTKPLQNKIDMLNNTVNTAATLPTMLKGARSLADMTKQRTKRLKEYLDKGINGLAEQ